MTLSSKPSGQLPTIRDPSSLLYVCQPITLDLESNSAFGTAEEFDNHIGILFGRANQRVRRTQERTVYVIVWLEVRAPPSTLV